MFDVTASNFQKIVVESPVPVLVDVYADWCGPCKQLGPMLEQAAVKAGGLFRLAKVNADNERAISGTLDVTGLPTVYAVSNGKFTDRSAAQLLASAPLPVPALIVRCIIDLLCFFFGFSADLWVCCRGTSCNRSCSAP